MNQRSSRQSHLERRNISCVGLTGGIGCGKSTVAQLFSSHGINVIDTDAIAHQLTQAAGEGISAILTAFGPDYISQTGALDRNKMRQLIFSDADAKHQLENILHPLILSHCKIQLESKTSAYAILMAPLLFESQAFLQLTQRVLLVECSVSNQILRVKQRNHLDEAEIRMIIEQQTSPAERIARTDDIIHNDGLIEELKNQVDKLHQCYLSMTKINTI